MSAPAANDSELLRLSCRNAMASSYTSLAVTISSVAMPTDLKMVVAERVADLLPANNSPASAKMGALERITSPELFQRRLARVDDEDVVHGLIIEFTPSRTWRANRIDMRAGLERTTRRKGSSEFVAVTTISASRTGLEIHGASPHGSPQTVLRGRACGSGLERRRSQILAQRLQMRLGLQRRFRAEPVCSYRGSQKLRHGGGNGGGAHLGNETPVHDGQRPTVIGLEQHDHCEVSWIAGASVSWVEGHQLRSHLRLGRRRHDAQIAFAFLDRHHIDAAAGSRGPTRTPPTLPPLRV